MSNKRAREEALQREFATQARGLPGIEEAYIEDRGETVSGYVRLDGRTRYFAEAWGGDVAATVARVLEGIG